MSDLENLRKLKLLFFVSLLFPSRVYLDSRLHLGQVKISSQHKKVILLIEGSGFDAL